MSNSTTNEVLNNIEKQVNEYGFNGTLYISCEDYGVIKTVLELQIPKKPVIGDTFSEKFQKAIIKTGSNPDMVKGQSYKCPVCNHRIIMLWEVERNKRIYGWKCKDIFCNKCGQALDWSDEE